ncbi:6-bladed beta-propeller, partial [Fodinibius halophilus]
MTNNIFWVITLISFLFIDFSQAPTPDTAKIIELEEYRTFISYEDQKLSNPQIIRYNDRNSHLFVYDTAESTVFEFDSNGEIVNRYGQRGRGPGEFLKVSNIFLANNYLYIVDPVQYRIMRFTFDGELAGSMNYGKGDSQALPPPAPTPLAPRAKKINNQPVVAENGQILLSNIYPG